MKSADLLLELIRIPSVNPMGRDASGPTFYESRLSDFLVDWLTALHLDVERHEVAPGRHNVVARYERPGRRTTILLDAHQDTVPVDGMVINPFDPAQRDGRIYGRGACDVKGGLAAMLAAVARLVRENPQHAASVVMSCTCDEEAGATGIAHLVGAWQAGGRRPDLAVIAEPTELDVVVAHRGATRWAIRTRGVACHSSRPEDGVNAIYRMGRVVMCLEEYARLLPASMPPHPLCGPATLSVGRVQGGSSVNTVPDECAIEIDRRVIPGEDALAVRDDVSRHLRDRLDFGMDAEPPWLVSLPLSDEHNRPLADALLSHIAAVAGPHRAVGVAYGTHASRTAAAGVPSVVFGPGSIDQAHTKDEWIAVDQLEQAAEIYYRFCADCGRLPRIGSADGR